MLAPMLEQRRTFKATVGKFGKKYDYNPNTGNSIEKTTILLSRVTEIGSGKVVSDHCWVTMGKRFEALKLAEGDTVQFDARVTEYLKGYVHRDEDYRTIDYRLSFPTNLKRISLEKGQSQISESGVVKETKS